VTFFGKVITAMITPFNSDGLVNYAEAEKLAAYLVDNGSDSLVVCGTTGESPTLTWEEEHELFRIVQQVVGNKAKVIAGTGSNCTQEAILATQTASKMGLDGSLQVVPYYNKPPQEGLYYHFSAIAQASPDLPIILYNVPGRTGQNLSPETIARLSSIPNIVAIKEASGNLDQASLIRRLTPPEFTLYSGDDSLTLPLMSIGGSGVISVASHLVGKLIQEMLQYFLSGHVNNATQIHVKLMPLFKALFTTTNPIPIKYALSLLGWQADVLRPPLCPLPEELVQSIKAPMLELGLLK